MKDWAVTTTHREPVQYEDKAARMTREEVIDLFGTDDGCLVMQLVRLLDEAVSHLDGVLEPSIFASREEARRRVDAANSFLAYGLRK